MELINVILRKLYCQLPKDLCKIHE